MALSVDLASDLSRLTMLLSDHRTTSTDFIVYSLALSASDAGANMKLKACHSWQETMKAKLLNLFLDVHRFTSLAITDTLLHD